MIQLYQFRCSHFCEKARWALDFKGIPWQAIDLVPGRHVGTVRSIAQGSSVPVLVDGAQRIQGSGAIITHLDQTRRERPLTPSDVLAASMALEWERYLDAQVGVPLRLWFYHHLLADRDQTLDFLLDGAPWHARPLFTLFWPRIRRRIRTHMKVTEENARQAERDLMGAFDRLDETLAQRRFLVGTRFSRADLTACALLGRFCLPAQLVPGRTDPAGILAVRERVAQRRFYTWVGEMYADYRSPSPKLAAAAQL